MEKIAGIGTDIVEVETVANAKYKTRLAEYFLTQEELALVPKNTKAIEYLASRFAAKEAVIKAFPKKLTPHEFSILKKGVRPVVVFRTKKYTDTYTVHLSLSHTARTATASAIITTSST
jgi:phosphopantetheine--protein transferase-like protein